MYRISLDDHTNSLSGIVDHLYLNEKFSDASILCKGHILPIHRFVMSTYSDYFASTFKKKVSSSQKVIQMNEYDVDNLKILLQFIYKGKAEINTNNIENLIQTIEDLQIKGIDIGILSQHFLSTSNENEDMVTFLMELLNLYINIFAFRL